MKKISRTNCSKSRSVTYVVNQDLHFALRRLDQIRRVVLAPRLVDAALQVAAERLVAPRALRRVRYRRECGARAVLVRAAERGEVQGERAVAAHGVPADGLAGEVLNVYWLGRHAETKVVRGIYEGEPFGLEDLRELHCDMCVHVIVLGVLWIRRIQVKAGA